jgi:hypothetical protein
MPGFLCFSFLPGIGAYMWTGYNFFSATRPFLCTGSGPTFGCHFVVECFESGITKKWKKKLVREHFFV